MPRLVNRLFVLAALSTASLATHAKAAEDGPVVVELFTSQSCSSCPAADRVLAELAQSDDILALERLVDYWDRLVVSPEGAWKDPFSSAANTDRQRAYNIRLRRNRGVYTPQAVVDGAFETVGSRRKSLTGLVEQARATSNEFIVSAAKSNDGYAFTIVRSESYAGPEPEAIFIEFQPRAVTRVEAGENRGATLTNVNIVLSADAVGKIDSAARTLNVSSTASSCALVVQAPNAGPILGAQRCPEDVVADL